MVGLLHRDSLLQAVILLIFAIQLAQSQSGKTYDTSLFSKHCLKDRPTHSSYKPQGKSYNVMGSLPVYEAGRGRDKRLLIAIYDIFGLSSNMKEVVDTMARMYNFRVVMPDFFRGKPWPEEDFPPKNYDDLENWMETKGSWEKVVKPDLQKLIKAYRVYENITEVAIFGMCWGGKIATLAATEIKEIKAAGLVHPSGVENSEAAGVKVPMYLLPSQDEEDMLPFYEVLKKKFGNNCGHRRFDEMPHGFAAARGDFTNPLNGRCVEEVIAIFAGFFGRNLEQ